MEEITASMRKTVRSLASRKGRLENGMFVTERTKNVMELLDGPFELVWLIGTHAWFEQHRDVSAPAERRFKAKVSDMERMTTLSTAPDVIAVFRLPENEYGGELNPDKLYIALDGVQDPGNMGTIMRLADWFGVGTVFAGEGTVDVFNPKCVIASMGSLARVKVASVPLKEVFDTAREKGITVWGTFLEGENLYDVSEKVSPTGIIVMGNEGNGISEDVGRMIDRKIRIPSYPPGEQTAESLNVAMAAAIVLGEFRRRKTTK